MIRDIEELTPKARQACRMFLAECEKAGLNVLITETYRSQERQNSLYEIGRTKPGKKVTWTKNSRHTSRRAWDICKNVKGAEYSDSGFFKECGRIAKNLGITWGGDWKTPDYPHFEISEEWRCEELMEDKELRAEVEELKKQVKIYHYGTELPEWSRDAVWKAQNKGVFSGASEEDLNVSEDVLKTLVFFDRLNLLD